MNGKPLISILVLCYNNQKFIYENLESIFSQTYPNIELLICDDASNAFDVQGLINWINKNRTNNITKIVIHENDRNMGTVTSLEILQKKSSGEYLFNIAADDVLYDNDVISKMYEKADELGDKGEFIIAQTEMWNRKLTKKIGDFIAESDIEFIKKATALEIFEECSWHAYIPASYLYKRSLLSILGTFADKYKLVEDLPMQLRATRKGIKPYYVDIRSSIKHRDGGISHGNTLHSQRTFLTYYQDYLNGYVNEVEPYLNLLSDSYREKAKKYQQDRIRAFYKLHVTKYFNKLEENKSSVNAAQPINNVKNLQESTGCIDMSYRKKEKIKNLLYKLTRKEPIGIYLILTLLFFLIASNAYMIPVLLWQILYWCFSALGIIFALLTIGSVLINILFKLRYFNIL